MPFENGIPAIDSEDQAGRGRTGLLNDEAERGNLIARLAASDLPFCRTLKNMSHPNLEIRLLAPTDSLAALTALLHRAYARLARMGLNYTAVDQSVETTASQIRQGVCFVAIAGNELVGTIGVRPPQQYPECPWYGQRHVSIANRFAVPPELQGKGIGSALLLRAESWAQEQKFSELAVDTAEPATHLIEFYARRGYRSICTVQWPGKKYRSVVLSKTISVDPPPAPDGIET